MKVFTDIDSCREQVRSAQRNGQTVGLVPTMGALHEGHLSLIRESQSQCSITAVTIFVNPAQFGPSEDFDRYPRPLEADLAACRSQDVDLVFTPSREVMYPSGSTHAATTVHVGEVTEGLCGPLRPGHFDGVATVVTKLFHILPADRAFFGEKDYQQLVVIRRLADDLNIPIEIIGCPTVRETDGLAMSSRNEYLSNSQRNQARSLSEALFAAADEIAGGARDVDAILDQARNHILQAGPAEIEYLEIVDGHTLKPMTVVDRPGRMCLAVRIGSVRLIDNVAVDVPRTDR